MSVAHACRACFFLSAFVVAFPLSRGGCVRAIWRKGTIEANQSPVRARPDAGTAIYRILVSHRQHLIGS